MFQKIIFYAVFAALSFTFAGCDMKDPIDEDVEGFWQLKRFETVSDGKVHRCERIYYSITRQVVEVAEKEGPNGYGAFIGRFGYQDGHEKVVMKDFKHRANTSDDKTDASVEELLPFGINSLVTTFDVLKSDGDNLVLESGYAILYLKRF